VRLITCSTEDFWKSKFTGFGPGDDNELVGESINLVHCEKNWIQS